MPLFPNKFPGTCTSCRRRIAAGVGVCEKINGNWTVRCSSPCEPAPIPAAAKVGDMKGILALFDIAKQHLKFPAIVLALTDTVSIRINVAGERARVPGSLTVVDAARAEGGRDWYGRILRDGTFEPSALGASLMPRLAEKLSEFAADPARVAGEDGRLHGRCCFCRIALTDERSTAVGYGPTCADHFGLPWGARPAEFGAAA
jgi:hypothetical protein